MVISEEDFGAVQDKITAWPILVVDDESEVYDVTAFVLEDISVAGIPVELIPVSSAAEAAELLKNRDDIAVILLDVVMESSDAGLRLVETIRDELKLQNLRIVLRTGQPGYAPEQEVMKKYDIDNYLAKSELSDTKLVTAVASAIRAYAHIAHLASLQNEYESLLHQREEEIATINDEMDGEEEQNESSVLLAEKSIMEGAWQQIPLALLPVANNVGETICGWLKERDIACQAENISEESLAYSGPLICLALFILYMESIGELENQEAGLKIIEEKEGVTVVTPVMITPSALEILQSRKTDGIPARYYLLIMALKMVWERQGIDVKLSLEEAGCLTVALNLIEQR